MSAEPKEKQTPSRKQPETQKQTRKERHQSQGEPEFALSEKVGYLLRKGGPWVIGVVLLVAGISWTVLAFRSEIQPDELSPEQEAQARQMISNAAKFERQGDEFVAAAELEALKKKFPNSIYREYADELLERHRSGQKMFTEADGEDGLVGIRERERRKGELVAVENSPGERRARRGERKETVAKADDSAAPPHSRRDAARGQAAAIAPDPPVPATMEEALAKASVIEVAKTVRINPLPDGFLIVGDAVHPTGWPAKIQCLADESLMVLVPGGKYHIGNDSGQENEKPVHEVTLPSFYIDQSEITRAQYGLFLKANPDHAKAGANPAADNDAKTPAVGVTYQDALAYCQWSKKQLPSEAQWETAGRGPQTYLFPWGNHRETASMGSNDKTVNTILSQPADLSPFAVFDLAGNVAEWCGDRYDDYKGATDAPTLSLKKPERVIRGGSPEWSLTWRASAEETVSQPWLGFRGALVPPQVEGAPLAETKPADNDPSERRAARGDGGAAAVSNAPAGTPVTGRESRGGRKEAPASTSGPAGNGRSNRDDRESNAAKKPVTSKPSGEPDRGSDRDRGGRKT